MIRLWAFLVLCLAVGLPQAAFAQAAAGSVVLVAGRVTATSTAGQVRTLAKGDAVYSGEVINSGTGSYVNLRFTDGGYFLLRPETRFQIEDYRYPAPSAATPAGQAPVAGAAPKVTTQAASDSEASRAFFRLVKGGFRSVSGLIGKVSREDYRVATPVATIGIRGTLFTARICQGACDGRAEIDERLRRAGVDPRGRKTILVTTVDEGEISVTTRTMQRFQKKGVVLMTDDEGTVTAVEDAPSIDQKDEGLRPELCQ